MKLLKTEINELVRNIPGGKLFKCQHRCKVTETNGDLEYTGPKIPPEVWNQILSFFKWTYDTTQSESQVRLFVSPKLGLWKAWAFPQEARTGLSTKELDTPDAKKQRADLFENHDDWTAWGTVHHHCSVGAFQSGVDESDEKNVGGLHITIGDIDKPQYSMHARLYHQGDLYEPDMSKFWDIGGVLETLPTEIRALIPENSGDKIARNQMCVPSTIEFPQQWKDNLIEVKRTPYSWESNWNNASSTPPELPAYLCGEGEYRWWDLKRYRKTNGAWVEAPEEEHASAPQKRLEKHRRAKWKTGLDPLPLRVKEGLSELIEDMALYGVRELELEGILAEIAQEEFTMAVLQICKDHDVLPHDLLEELHDWGDPKAETPEEHTYGAS